MPKFLEVLEKWFGQQYLDILQINCAKCLDHKHIAKLLDVVAHEGRLALAVSYVQICFICHHSNLLLSLYNTYRFPINTTSSSQKESSVFH